MKKNFFLAASLASLFLVFTACEQAYEKEIKKQDVKIFMSYTIPQQSGEINSKSSVSRTIITTGDTVDVCDLRNINIILAAETDQGFKFDGFWAITPVDLELNEVKGAYITNAPAYASEGSLIAIKLPMLGVYKATFKQKNGLAERSFFIRHTGMPGDIGDNFENDCIFRLEKNVYQTYEATGNLLKHGYSLYLRSPEGEFDFLNDGKGPGDLQALIFGENQQYITPVGWYIGARNIKLERCKYSKEYLKVTFFSEDIPAIDGIYEICFYAGNYGDIWFVPESISKSNWNVGKYIVFKTF